MTTIRREVLELSKLGPMPDSTASEEEIASYQELLMSIKAPVSDDEAMILARCFGNDECYGLAWALLHLIESAPGGIPIKTAPAKTENEWIRRLWDRSHR